jgi:hypothetical protein
MRKKKKEETKVQSWSNVPPSQTSLFFFFFEGGKRLINFSPFVFLPNGEWRVAGKQRKSSPKKYL